MNRTYKVAKSLTRGVVVTSEKASSYQGKAVKTVIAAAAALVAGSAIAVPSYVAPSDSITPLVNTGITELKDLNKNAETVWKHTEVKQATENFFSTTDGFSFDKTLWIVGDVKKAAGSTDAYVKDFHANGLWLDGADKTGINTGTIYVTTANDAQYWQVKAMGSNEGTIIAKNAVAMTFGSKTATKKLQNDGLIVVEDQGRGLELGGGANAAGSAENNGRIVVGAPAKGATEIGAVYIGDGSKDNTFTNNKGASIEAADAGYAIYFGTGSGNTATLASGSVTQGDIVVKSADSTNNIEIEKGASVTGDVIVKLGTAALTGDEGAAVDGDLIAAAGAATVAKELTFKNVTVGTAAVEKTDTTPEVKATDGSVTVNSKSELYADAVTLNTAGSVFTNNGYTELGTVTFAKVSAGTPSTTADSDKGFVNNGEAVIEKLVFVNGSDVFTNGTNGSVEIGSVVVPLNSDGSEVALTGVTNEGKVYTDLKNVAAKDEDGKWGATAFGTALKNTSILDESITSDVTLDEYKEIIGVLGNGVALHSANITTKDGGAISLDDANKVGSGDFGHAEVAGTYKSDKPIFSTDTQISKDLSFGSFTFTPASEKTPAITSAALGNTANKITLRGDKNGNVINGVKSDVAVTLTNVNFGAEDEDRGTLQNDIVIAGDTKVVGSFTARDVQLDGTGALAVEGNFTVDQLSKAANASSGAATVQEFGTLTVLGEKLPADAGGNPAADQTLQIGDAAITVTANADDAGAYGSMLVAGNYTAAANAYHEAHEEENVVYVGQATTFNGTVTFNQNNTSVQNAVVIDMAGLAADASYKAVTADKDGVKTDHRIVNAGTALTADKLVINNLQAVSHDSLKYDEENKVWTALVGNVNNTTSVDVGSLFYKPTYANGVLTFNTDKELLADIRSLGLNTAGQIALSTENLQFNQNAVADKIIFGLEELVTPSENVQQTLKAEAEKLGLTLDFESGDYELTIDPTNADQVAFDQKVQGVMDGLLTQLINAENAATNMAALGGAFTTALDINDQVTAAVSRRTSAQRVEGFTPWVDVFGTTNEAKRLYGNGAGYEADIYGAVLGFDYTAACGGTLGVAFNVGQADGNSVGSGAKVDNDADFYGVSLYGAQTFGDFNVKADLGYTQVSNDLSTNNVLGSYKESLDANVFTFGLGTEYLAKFGALNVTPHAGIRLSRIDMDDSKCGADYDAMTVYQLPLGVAFSGNFDVNGWKLAPMVDLSVVPAFGDKDAVATYTGGIQSVTRVVDTNPIQATLGVSAQNGAWTFGLNYGLTAGGDDRMNNAFNANLRYSF
ncbi:autotransporter outer membrane beta-barrel domain-containing protein [Sutterella wadsworthensis]|uniref:autotransporter outer membrane beta-barrel domain-containing protein n=1 Tax=Sutterella wadsworthensis TaxID=40545 RepID=UPI00242B9DA3|nr:autotransporter outer membrane beta-barrel domain-containing protein [Sutterella wadsworthensis]